MQVQKDLPRLRGFISISEWAAKLGISRSRAHEYVQEGRIKAWSLGHMTIVRGSTPQPKAIGRKLKSEQPKK